MTDLSAAIGLVELKRYDNDTLKRRKEITDLYIKQLSGNVLLELPMFHTAEKTSSYHLFPVRIKGAKEEQRDEIMRLIFEQDVSVNVHFIPVPGMSYYKKLGYSEKHYPVAYDNYCREITLPLYYNLSNEDVFKVCTALNNALKQVM